MMTLVEIKELSVDDISGQLRKSQKELVELRMKFASRQLEDSSQIRKKRKEIARLHTVKTQKSKETVSTEPKAEKIKKVKKKVKKEEVSLVSEKPKRKTKTGEKKSEK